MSEELQQDDGESGEQQPENSHRNRAEHLAQYQFKPGQSGNPGGRPKGRTLLSVIREMLAKPNGDEAQLEASAMAYIEKMQQGSFPHLKEYIDREEGKVPDSLEVKGELSGRITILPPWVKRQLRAKDPEAAGE